jgi:tetrahydromethanopterin S-methyltransferase subunit H
MLTANGKVAAAAAADDVGVSEKIIFNCSLNTFFLVYRR